MLDKLKNQRKVALCVVQQWKDTYVPGKAVKKNDGGSYAPGKDDDYKF